MTSSRPFLYIFAAMLFFTGPAGLVADDWTQWRGLNRDSQIAPASWPQSLSDQNLQRRWRIRLGPSYSGPIVVGDRVFTTETRDRKYEVVQAVDRRTGQKLWESKWEGAMKVPFFARSNGDWIRATPTYSEGRLYVSGMRDVLVCLDATNGAQLWRVDFKEKFRSPLPSFGCVCSPLVTNQHVYMQAGGSVVKLDKTTGAVVWRALKDGGGMSGGAFSSPVLTKLGGREQLVVQTRTKLAGVDAAAGEVQWSQDVPAFRGMNILTPMVVGETIFTSSYGGRTFLYALEGQGKVAERWTNKAQGYMSSPVVIKGHVYLHLRNQRFTCINLATGETTWTSKPYGKYWSMVANGDRILALDQRGDLLLIQADPKQFNLIDSRKISDEETWAHLAVAGGEVVVRELNALTAFEWK